MTKLSNRKNMPYFSEQTFQNQDFSITSLTPGEYDNCQFLQCKFSGLNLNGFSFENCSFKNCDLSNLKVPGVAFRNIKFEGCKMLGIHFHSANPFLLEFSFQSCQLDYCSFYNLQLKKSKFLNCRMLEADFTQADLSSADFQGSDLSGVVFNRTVLEKTDFRNAQGFRLDPELNRIKGARFDLDGLPGLLGKYGIKVG